MDQKTNNFFNNKVKEAEKLLEKGEYFLALKHLKSLDNKHEHFIISWYLGHTYFKLHNYLEAIKQIKKSIKIKSKDVLNLNFLGEIFLEINDYKQAIRLFEEVLKLEPNNLSSKLNLAKVKLYQGKIKDSEIIYKNLVAKDPLNIACHYQLMRINEKNISNEIIDRIIKNYSKLSLENKIYSRLILAKNDEKNKKFSSEFDNLINAHQIYSKSKQKATNQQYEYYMNCLPNFINKLPKLNLTADTNLAPIFIMGLPRSGTTLIEKIINSGNKKIQSLGEADIFDKVFYSNQILPKKNKDKLPDFKFLQKKLIEQYHIQGLKKKNLVFTDKSISNFLYLELILNIFPKAKLIYCYRNPAANIIGILRSFLPNIFWSHSLDKTFLICDLYYKKLEKIKKNKSINLKIISLEELTQKPEAISKDLFKFLDFEWSEDCINIESNEIFFKTASNLDVRKKIRKHNLDYTSNYLKIIKDLGYNYDWLF